MPGTEASTEILCFFICALLQVLRTEEDLEEVFLTGCLSKTRNSLGVGLSRVGAGEGSMASLEFMSSLYVLEAS